MFNQTSGVCAFQCKNWMQLQFTYLSSLHFAGISIKSLHPSCTISLFASFCFNTSWNSWTAGLWTVAPQPSCCWKLVAPHPPQCVWLNTVHHFSEVSHPVCCLLSVVGYLLLRAQGQLKTSTWSWIFIPAVIFQTVLSTAAELDLLVWKSRSSKDFYE